jgi:hypothetical protein
MLDEATVYKFAVKTAGNISAADSATGGIRCTCNEVGAVVV